MIRVELLRAWPQRHEATTVELADGARVADALERAGWGMGGDFVGLAVFGQAADGQTMLHDGDRVELLRRLELDPKQARRRRAGRRNRKA